MELTMQTTHKQYLFRDYHILSRVVLDDMEYVLLESDSQNQYRYATCMYIPESMTITRESFYDSYMEALTDLCSRHVKTGIKNGSSGGDIVELALSQVGNVGGQPCWSWYGFTGRVECCACFVSWCANECGYIEAGIIPKFAAYTSQGMPWFQNRSQWQGRGYEPSPGDMIFFDWDVSGDADHVGIVEKCETGVVYTIEGHSNDMCRRNSYPVNSPVIRGYGVPAY